MVLMIGVIVIAAWGMAHLVIRRGAGRAIAIIFLFNGVVFAGLILKARTLQGFDGVGYVAIAGILCAPIALGIGLGALTAIWAKRKAQRRAHQGAR